MLDADRQGEEVGNRGESKLILRMLVFVTGSLVEIPGTQEAEVKLFRSFLPQLCKRTANHDFGAIVKHMPKDFYIEEKMDGERIQLHKRGNEYFYCSR
jgi:ATP-dependent DNA ligase